MEQVAYALIEGEEFEFLEDDGRRITRYIITKDLLAKRTYSSDGYIDGVGSTFGWVWDSLVSLENRRVDGDTVTRINYTVLLGGE